MKTRVKKKEMTFDSLMYYLLFNKIAYYFEKQEFGEELYGEEILCFLSIHLISYIELQMFNICYTNEIHFYRKRVIIHVKKLG